MKLRNSLLKLTFFLILFLITNERVVAQSTEVQSSKSSSAISSLNDVRLRRGSLSRLYWARVLMEDYERWPEASELLRYVIMTDTNLPNPVLKKLRRVHFALRAYPVEELARKSLDMRHMTQAFLLTQYLLNEAIMDMRVNINESNGIELKFVKKLLQSYFFPGSESVGEILYPADASYDFDLYALTKLNIAAAALDPSDYEELNQNLKPIPGPATDGRSNVKIPEVGAGGVIFPQSSVNQGALDRLSLLNRQGLAVSDSVKIQPSSFFVPNAPAQSFLDALIDLGMSVDQLSKYAEDVWAEVQPSNRVSNKYLPESLMLQALSDPGSIVVDPQIQDFLRGTRLKLKVADLSQGDRDDIIEMFSAVGSNNLNPIRGKDGKDLISIDLAKLIQDQSQEGLPQLKLLLEHEKGAFGKWSLYAVTGVGGADLFVLRFLQLMLKTTKEWESVKSVLLPSGIVDKVKFAEYLATLPAKIETMNRAQRILWKSNSWWHAHRWMAYTVRQAWFHGLKWGDQAYTFLNPRMASFLEKLEKSKLYRKTKAGARSGSLLYFIGFAAAATQLTTGVLDARSAENDSEALEIYVSTAAKSSSSLTYMLPYVGWPALGLDMVNRVGWTDWETADLYRKGEYFLLEMLTGEDLTKLFMEGFEAQYNLPEPAYIGAALAKQIEDAKSDPEEIRNELSLRTQDLAHRYINVFYVSHKEALKFGRYSFAEKIEDYYQDFIATQVSYSQQLGRVNDLEAKGYYKKSVTDPSEETQE